MFATIVRRQPAGIRKYARALEAFVRRWIRMECAMLSDGILARESFAATAEQIAALLVLLLVVQTCCGQIFDGLIAEIALQTEVLAEKCIGVGVRSNRPTGFDFNRARMSGFTGPGALSM